MARFIWSQVIVVVLGIGLSGCKSGPEKGAALDSLARQPGSGSADGSGYTVYQPHTDYMSDSQLEPTPTSDVSPASATGYVDKLRSAAHSIKDGLYIEPSVVRAADPTQLRYNPGPIQPQLFLSAAALCEQQGQLVKAAEQYKRLLELDPKNRSAMIGLGRLNHRTGDLDAAIGIYTKASQDYANDPVILNDLGLCLARAGRINEAMATLQTAIRLKPASKLYRNNLAAVMVEANRASEAVALLEPAHGAAVAHYNVAYMLHQRGNVQAATDHFGKALQINPSFEPARQMLNQMTPQIGTMPARRVAPRQGFRTGMVIPNAQPLQSPSPPARAPVVPKSAIQQAPVVQAVGATDSSDATTNVQVTHVEPVSKPPALEISPLETQRTGIRLPLPRRTMTNQGTLLPPSPGEVPSAARTVNFLPVAE